MKKALIAVALVISLVCFYGPAFSGDGAEDPACHSLPNPTSGPFLVGGFTVAYDKSDCSLSFPTQCGHYGVQMTLTKGGKVHLFSDKAGLVAGPGGYKNLCSFTASELQTTFAKHPCNLGVGQAFGISGTPVIADLHILLRDFCNAQSDNDLVPNTNIVEDAMIAGEIVIRVVPNPK